MKPVMFKNFLARYAKSMTSKSSLSLNHAEEEALSNERFLSLFTLLLLFDRPKASALARAQYKYPVLWECYQQVWRTYSKLHLEDLEQEIKQLDPFDELRKAYTSYQRLVLQMKDREKSTLTKGIKKQLEEKNISVYRIYKDLHLNPGNVNDFFKNENYDKLSLKTLHKIFTYVQEATPSDGYTSRMKNTP